ncbi:hypothetical protein B0H11DRAFT_2233170 [Mycena galericulata]|nr:hypothetical protein B0H11DRAFT_2233170 [Mycena galericulata]
MSLQLCVPVMGSDVAMTFELFLDPRLFGPTTLQGDADVLLAFFRARGGAQHCECIFCKA